jgi:hypothetical protein
MKRKILLPLALVMSGILSGCSHVAQPANEKAATARNTLALIEPWTNVAVKYVVAGSSLSPETKSKTETAGAKQAVYKSVGPKIGGGPFREEFWIMAFHDPHTGKNSIIDADHTFYVSLDGQLTGFSVFAMDIVWTSSYVALDESEGNLDEAVGRFEAQFDGQKLNQEVLRRNVNRIRLRSACPMYYFSDAPAPGGYAPTPIVEAIDITDGILRLDIRNPKTKVPASLWLNPREHKVLKSVLDGQEMDRTTGGLYAIPLKNF